MLERISALAGVTVPHQRQGVNGRIACRLGEVRGWSLVEISGFPGTMSRIEAKVRQLTGADVPALAGTAARTAAAVIFRTGPEQVWIVAREGSLSMASVRDAIPPETGAAIDLSHGRTRIFIEGKGAVAALRKGLAVDLANDRFGIDQFAMTGLHHMPILIHRVTEERYEIYAMRTFALAVWDWLTDAALEFGYEVIVGF